MGNVGSDWNLTNRDDGSTNVVTMEGIECQLDIMRDELAPASLLGGPAGGGGGPVLMGGTLDPVDPGVRNHAQERIPDHDQATDRGLKRYLAALRNHAQLSRLERSTRRKTIDVQASADGVFRSVS